MIEYELIQQRNAELRRIAQYESLVREARRAKSGRTGLFARFGRRTAPLGEA
ncbi:hypothetical protein ABT095_11530 [Kitasatospora sp. NPDC002227]|uniref:hypothetical protein n=1 Tax=Kitasatospora sp. NPDC002227 TaxID=3154773 RepID=UPI00332FDA54